MELRDDHAFGSANDERAFVRHQGDLAEEDFLLLDVSDRFPVGALFLLEDGQLDRDLQRSGIGHPALLALVDVVLQLEAYRVTAFLAERNAVRGQGAALAAEQVRRPLGIALDCRVAVVAPCPQVEQPSQAPALAFPVADRVANELKGAHLAEVRDWEHRLEDGLKAEVLPLARQQFHLQESLVRVTLHLDQVRDRDRRPDLGEVVPVWRGHCGRGTVRPRGRRFVHTCLLLAVSSSIPISERNWGTAAVVGTRGRIGAQQPVGGALPPETSPRLERRRT